MSRLIDRLFYDGADFHNAPRMAHEFRQSLSEAVPILIDNVARYYFTNKGVGEWTLSDFPNIAPPFEKYWMEFKGIGPQEIGQQMWAELSQDYSGNATVPIACGLLVESFPVDETAVIQDSIDDSDNTLVHYDPKEVKWYTRSTVVYELPNWKKPMVIGLYHIYITPEGEQHPTSKRRMHTECFWRRPVEEPKSLLDVRGWENYRKAQDDIKILMAQFARLVLMPAMLATTFLHCGNVSIEADASVPAFKKKSWLKKKKRPMVEFKVLNIGGVTRSLKESGSETEGTGLKRALGIRRGFFRHYGPKWGKGKLFGKHEGMFWTPDRNVGDESEGTVVKTYNVKGARRDANRNNATETN